MARKYGVEELLPPTKKSSIERDARRAQREAKGLTVRGHRVERTLKARYVGRKRVRVTVLMEMQDRDAEGCNGEDAEDDRGVEAEGSWKGVEGLAEWEGEVLDAWVERKRLYITTTAARVIVQHQNPLHMANGSLYSDFPWLVLFAATLYVQYFTQRRDVLQAVLIPLPESNLVANTPVLILPIIGSWSNTLNPITGICQTQFQQISHQISLTIATTHVPRLTRPRDGEYKQYRDRF